MDAIKIRRYQFVIARVVQQECVVAVRRVDLRIGDVEFVLEQRMDDFS